MTDRISLKDWFRIGDSLVPTTLYEIKQLLASGLSIDTSSPLTGGGTLDTDVVIGIGQASGSTAGYLSAEDWTAFNAKQGSITLPLSVSSGGTGTGTAAQNAVFAGPTSGSGAPGFRTLTGGDVPDLSGTYLTPAAHTAIGDGSPHHASVTLGTANGLALSGQQLSMGTSGSASTGALSSTDWNTFNGKMTAADHTAIGNNSPHHAPVTLGTANGLTLSGQQLALGTSGSASAGALSSTDWNTFNGKQSALTFPLAANLGGTGISNAAGSTLTLGAALSVTGGGTIGLGGYTLTVPATGTAALGTGAANRAAFWTGANAISYDNAFIWDNTNKRLGIGVTPSYALHVSGQTYHDYAANSASEQYSHFFYGQNTGGGNIYSIYGRARGKDASLNYATGMFYIASIQNTTASNMTAVAARASMVYNEYRLESTGNLTVASGLPVYIDSPSIIKTGAGTLSVTSQYGALIHNQGNAYTGTSYGININNQSGSTTNYALYTGTGLVRLGDAASIVGSQDATQFTVTGYSTQTNTLAQFTRNDGATNAATTMITLTGNTTGTAAANFGTDILTNLESSTTAGQNASRIRTYWSTATHATRTSAISLSTVTSAAALAEKLRIDGATIQLGDIAGGNAIQIASDGHMTLLGTATVWDDLRIEPIVKSASSNSPSFTQVYTDGAGSRGVYVYIFDDAVLASQKEVHFQVQLPHAWLEGSSVYPHVHWIPVTAGSAGNKVRWGLEYTKAKLGTAFGNTTLIYADTTAVGTITTAGSHSLTSFSAIDMTGDTLSTVILCRLWRDSANAADTYTGNAGLLYIDFHIEINRMGSNTEFA